MGYTGTKTHSYISGAYRFRPRALATARATRVFASLRRCFDGARSPNLRSDLLPLGCSETVRVTTVRGIIVGFLKLSSSMASPAASSNTRSDNGEK
jgi:hypothetical protein